jgi:hypothetical protein
MQQETFYMATDDSAVHHIEKQLNVIGIDLMNPKIALQHNIMQIID